MDTFSVDYAKNGGSLGFGFLAEEYAYVIFDFFLVFVMHVVLGFRISYLRGKLHVDAPTVVSDTSHTFNVAERVHQNTLENAQFFFVSAAIGGIRHPILAAVFGFIWIICRVVYVVGYTIHQKYRLIGFLATLVTNLCLFGLMFSTAAGLLNWW